MTSPVEHRVFNGVGHTIASPPGTTFTNTRALPRPRRYLRKCAAGRRKHSSSTCRGTDVFAEHLPG